MAFDVEEIPDQAILFRRINQVLLTQEGEISSAAYKDPEMSVNWEKYSTAEQTADASSAFVTGLSAGRYRGFNQTVVHKPVEPGQPDGPNQAHSEVKGHKTKSLARQMKDAAQIVWVRSHS